MSVGVKQENNRKLCRSGRRKSGFGAVKPAAASRRRRRSSGGETAHLAAKRRGWQQRGGGISINNESEMKWRHHQ